jgi:hypothetical protein
MQMTAAIFSSERISKTSVIALNGPLAAVFPLFGPIREKEWAPGWDPQILFSTTNLVDEHMVFKSPAHLGHGEPDYVWTLSKYRPEEGFLEYTVYSPERLWWITISCYEQTPDKRTSAEITYTYTGLTAKGNALNEKSLAMIYAHDLEDWEGAINHYLESGEKLENH